MTRLQSTGNIEMVPDFIQRMTVASDGDVASVALCESIFDFSQSVGFRTGWNNSGVGEELQRCQ